MHWFKRTINRSLSKSHFLLQQVFISDQAEKQMVMKLPDQLQLIGKLKFSASLVCSLQNSGLLWIIAIRREKSSSGFLLAFQNAPSWAWETDLIKFHLKCSFFTKKVAQTYRASRWRNESECWKSEVILACVLLQFRKHPLRADWNVLFS